jgi:hypothetical protein
MDSMPRIAAVKWVAAKEEEDDDNDEKEDDEEDSSDWEIGANSPR